MPVADAKLALDPDNSSGLGGIAPQPTRVVAAVGPEGGFGAADWRQLDAVKFVRIGLGRRVLRTETAALAACAIAQALWGDV